MPGPQVDAPKVPHPGFGDDYMVAIANTRALFEHLKQRFNNAIRGISVWGSVSEKYFMLPVDVTGLTTTIVSKLRAADLPIRGESRGSDIDATLYVAENSSRAVADYLGGIIDALDRDMRFEHVVIAEYEAVLILFSRLKQLFLSTSQYGGLVHEVPVYFVISRDAQKKTPFERNERVSDTVMKFRLARPYFESAFLGYHHGVSEDLEHLLDISPEQRQFLMEKNQQEMEADAAYFATYLRKKNRFAVLRDILDTVQDEHERGEG